MKQVFLLLALVLSNLSFPVLFENEYSIGELQNLLKNHAEKSTVDALIPVFKEAFPENFRSRYLLIHKSNSLQKATFDLPRIILFTDDAKFILAMTGHASLRGGEALEAIQYNNEIEAFDFYQLTYQDGSWKTEVNPVACQTCHTKHPRPNFEGYNLWPGAYGANDDKIGKTTPEATAFKRFIQKSAFKGRYEMLSGIPSLPELENTGQDFYSISTNRQIYSHIYSDNWERNVDIDYGYTIFPRANYKFTQESGRLAIRQLAWRLKKAPHFDELKPLLLKALRQPVIGQAIQIPEHLLQTPALDINLYEKETYRSVYSFRLNVVKRTLPLFGTPSVPFEQLEKTVWEKKGEIFSDFGYRSVFFNSRDYLKAAHFRYVLDSVGQPLNLKEIGTSHSHPGYSFTFGNNGIEWLAQALEK